MKKDTILVVDDSVTNLHILNDFLKDSGLHVLSASNGETAIRQSLQEQPDMILLDVLMPGIDGFETCRRLKQNQQTQDIPVIFMTALTSTNDKIKGFSVGGVDYLTKPLHYPEVLVRVTTHIENRKLQRQLKTQNLRLEEQTVLLEEKNARLQQEVTDKQHAEKILTDTLQQVEIAKHEWESTADSLKHIMICLLDKNRHILRLNRTIEHWKRGHVLTAKGQNVHKLLHADCTSPDCPLREIFDAPWDRLEQNHPLEYAIEDSLLQRRLNIQLRLIGNRAAITSSSSFVVCVIQDVTNYKRVEEALKQRTQDLLQLNQLSNSLQRCQTENESYHVLVGVCQKLYPCSSGSFNLLAPEESEFRIVSSWGKPQRMTQQFGIDDEWIFDHSQAPLFKPTDSEKLIPSIGYAANSKSVCVPVGLANEIFGMLTIDFSQCYQSYSEETYHRQLESIRPVLTGLVEHYALSLSNLRLRETLRQESILDPLTQLYNRRHMEISLSREIRRAKRHSTPLGIILLDVDHFKKFNDSYGHEAGDIVLQEMGTLLRRHIRAEDIACRYGGEEFLLILPEATIDGTKQRAEELRIMVKQLHIPYHEELLEITISLGVASLPEHGLDARDILHAADTALYQAKAQGRNRVVVIEHS
ncbi:MAG: diguanylate cyclase [bacterium]|nr:diguanylate cyclase [bacterium]